MSQSRRPVALVTGGRRGIGLGIARALAREGYDLALSALSAPEQAAGAVAELEALGAQVHYQQADIADAPARQGLWEAVERRFGVLNLLVNNAGVAPKIRADLLEATEESFEQVLRTNLQGPYFLTQAAARMMIRFRQADPSCRACIVNITSISSTVASVNRGDYCLSKAALSMATRLWAVRLAEFGIPVYEIRPGIVETDMTAGVREKYERLIANGLLLEPRWGRPEEIGRAVAMLARGELPYASGQVLTLDGGLTLPRL